MPPKRKAPDPTTEVTPYVSPDVASHPTHPPLYSTPWLAHLEYVFLHPAPVAGAMTAFYPAGARWENPFLPHYNEASGAVVLLASAPHGLGRQREYLQNTIVAILGPGQSPTSVRTFVWNVLNRTLVEHHPDAPMGVLDMGDVAVMEVRYGGVPGMSQEARFNLLAYTHAATAMALIGCETRVER